MAILRRNAPWFGLVLFLCTVGLIGWWVYSPIPQTQALVAFAPFEPATPLARLDAARLEQLRRDVGLDDDTLGALGLSDAELDSVLSGLRGWYEQHAAALDTARSATADAHARIRSIRSKMDTGGDTAALTQQLTAARTELATAQSAYETLLTGVRSSVVGAGATERLSLINRMRSQKEMPMPYRALALSAEQRKNLRKALNAQAQRAGGAGPAVDWDVVLGAGSAQQMASINATRGPASSRVVAALKRNLPVEAEPSPGVN